jgi:hypothetical protein
MTLIMDAKTNKERIERLEKVLGIVYTKKGNVASVSCCFGGISKVEVQG